MLRVRSTFLLLAAAATAARALVPDWAPPLSTRGRYVVDAHGNRFKLKSGNWHGGSGTWNGKGDPNDDANSSGENSHNMPLGLQYVPIDQILDSFEQIGVNSIRLQWSNEMIHDTTPIRDEWVAANPQFKGKTTLEVYDAVVKALTDRRFAVIINNHTNKNRWCCGVGDGSERWNESQSEDDWIRDWVFMVTRFKDNKRVVGADLYNEVRRDILDDPNWGGYDAHDWYLASQHAADAILTRANSDVLIIIEGINWVGIPVDGFYHNRPTLTPARELSHTLIQSNKLVYSAHFYAYTGPHHTGATGLGETSDLRYRDFSVNDLYNVYRDQASFVALDSDAHYVAPLWMSEFGIGRLGSPDIDKAWFGNTVKYLVDNDIDFAYWPLVGYLENGQGNGWSLQSWSRAGQRDGLLDGSGSEWRKDLWMGLVNSTNERKGAIDEAARWDMLNIDKDDYVKSAAMQGNDWDGGAGKAACPDGERLIGISAGAPARGLCTSAGPPGLRPVVRTEVIKDERYVHGNDWAGGYAKYQCADGQYAIGYSIRGAKVSSVLCAQSDQALGMGSSRTIWFDQHDDRSGDHPQGGEFASHQLKGQCANDEHVAGVAWTTSLFRRGTPAAILCRK